MKIDTERFFEEFKKDITEYGEVKLELLKLGVFERTGKVLSILSYALILLTLGFFLSLFIFLALGFFLSEWFHSTGIGFSIVAMLYLVLIGIVVGLKEKIKTYILNIVIEALITNDNEIDETDTPNTPETDTAQ